MSRVAAKSLPARGVVCALGAGRRGIRALSASTLSLQGTDPHHHRVTNRRLPSPVQSIRYPLRQTIGNSVQRTYRYQLSALRHSSIFTGTGNGDSEDADSVAQKEEFLNTLLAKYPERVKTEDYLVVLRAIAASKLPDAAMRAERWLYRLEQQSEIDQEGESSTMLTAECYQRVIEAWSTATTEDPARVVTRAERWLKKHMDSPLDHLRPNTACFNAFLNACTKGRAFKGSKNSKLVREHAQKAEDVLHLMIAKRTTQGPTCTMAPNNESFNLVIRGWTRCRRNIGITEKAMSALRLLERYQADVDASVKPDSKSYGMVMDSMAVKASLKVKRCNSNITGKQEACRDQSQNGLEEIQLLRNTLELLYEKSKAEDPSIAPNTFTYNMLLSGWANVASLHENAPSEAENILRHMKALKDDGRQNVGADAASYMLVIRAWVNSGLPNRGQRVAWLLQSQWKAFEFEGDINLRPTVASYNLVMRAWVDLAQPLEAEKVLSELLRLSAQEDNKDLVPNSESFSIMIRAWLAVAKKGSDQALRSAVRWLDILVQREKAETGISSASELYTNILGAARMCASYSPGVLDLAIEVFEKLRASHHMMECIHYSRLLQVVLLSLRNPKNDGARKYLVTKIIKETQAHGFVGSPLLQALANGPVYSEGWTAKASEELVEELFPHHALPPNWSRNVKRHDHAPNQKDFVRTKFYSTSQQDVDPHQVRTEHAMNQQAVGRPLPPNLSSLNNSQGSAPIPQKMMNQQVAQVRQPATFTTGYGSLGGVAASGVHDQAHLPVNSSSNSNSQERVPAPQK